MRNLRRAVLAGEHRRMVNSRKGQVWQPCNGGCKSARLLGQAGGCTKAAYLSRGCCQIFNPYPYIATITI